VCGDDDAAKQVALQLVTDAGMKGWDAGPLDNAVAIEGLTPILLGLNKKYKIKGAGITITGG
jgi:predicted dinucleotide-binding enzyme